jgi:UDP-N-acetylmuramoyl-tripeptide--D-alanyl-D-alanine ligase
MEPRSLQSIAAACGGRLLRGLPSATVSNVGTDSRAAPTGGLFVALAGERFDGHEFVVDAVRRGAVAALVDRQKLPPAELTCAVIAVENTRVALGQLAAAYRAEFHVPVVAVAGSNGKTTTKDLLVSILQQRAAVLGSRASFNNNIGVPLTVLEWERTHWAAVFELGTNHPGELAPLVKMVRPQSGILTSIGREHLEFFRTLEGVAEEQGWLAELLPADGTLWFNGDTPRFEQIARRAGARIVRVGLGPENDWRARELRADETGIDFGVEAPLPGISGRYRVNLLGRHQVTNALLALAVGATLGLTADELRSGLAACPPARRRLEVWSAHGVRVLDDAYNANPDSMDAALRTLQAYPCAARRVAVLGDMAEAGSDGAALHAEVGRTVAELGIDQLFAVGSRAAVMGAGARAAGLYRVLELGDIESAAAAVARFVRPGDVVLVKASRASRLERVSEALRAGVRSS